MAHEEIANAFVQHFYTTLDTNPTGLSSLYQPQSTLTFEGTSVTGADAIVAKYQVSSSLPREFHFVVQNVLVIFKEGIGVSLLLALNWHIYNPSTPYYGTNPSLK
jgi:hypothetical protein